MVYSVSSRRQIKSVFLVLNVKYKWYYCFFTEKKLIEKLNKFLDMER